MTEEILVKSLPIIANFMIYKGKPFCQNLRFKKTEIDPQTGKPVKVIYPLTGWTAKAEIRPSDNSPVLTAEMVVNVTEAEGMISLALTAEQTAAIKPGVYYWDLRTEKPNEIPNYWMRGQFLVSGRVTE